MNSAVDATALDGLTAAQTAVREAEQRYGVAAAALDVAQERWSEYAWGRSDAGDPNGQAKVHAREARDAAIQALEQAKSELATAKRTLAQCETRATALAGPAAVHLKDAEDQLAAARIALREAEERRDRAQAALTSAQEKRRTCLQSAAAAVGEPGTSKALKTATAARDEAAEILEIANATVESAQRQVAESETRVAQETVRSLCSAALRHGERRVELIGRIDSLIAQLFAELADYQSEGLEAARILSMAHNLPADASVAGTVLDHLSARQDGQRILDLFVQKMPVELYSSYQLDPPFRSANPADVVAAEISRWRQVAAVCAVRKEVP